MKRFAFSLILACALSSVALAGDIPSTGAPAPGEIPTTGSPGQIPTVDAPGEIPTLGISALMKIFDLAF